MRFTFYEGARGEAMNLGNWEVEKRCMEHGEGSKKRET